MKNIHVLPTDKPSRFQKTKHDNFFLASKIELYTDCIAQHIYITSDEEIKEGDVVKIPCGVGKVKELNWKFGNNSPSYIVEDIFIYKLRYGQKEGELQINSFRYEDVKKIILTTDGDLIKDCVQAIDDEFLEWFVKNPSCEEVEIERDSREVGSHNGGIVIEYGLYEIIIPKEETKQTVVEWLYNHLFPKQLDGFSDEEWNKIDLAFNQAKEMEKQQIIDAWVADDNELQRIAAEQYYNETFKNK